MQAWASGKKGKKRKSQKLNKTGTYFWGHLKKVFRYVHEGLFVRDDSTKNHNQRTRGGYKICGAVGGKSKFFKLRNEWAIRNTIIIDGSRLLWIEPNNGVQTSRIASMGPNHLQIHLRSRMRPEFVTNSAMPAGFVLFSFWINYMSIPRIVRWGRCLEICQNTWRLTEQPSK